MALSIISDLLVIAWTVVIVIACVLEYKKRNTIKRK